MRHSRIVLLCLAVILPISFAAAQNDATSSDSASPLTRSNHVVVIMEENRSVDAARQYMPYLRSLADQYAQELEVYSESHGSWLAYGEMPPQRAKPGGQGVNGTCNGDGCTQTITIDNLVRHFAAQHKSWRGYFESMPTVGFLGYHFDLYYRRHNPFAFYSDLVYILPQHFNLVPTFNHMLQDFQNNNLANFTWISPNVGHDADEGSDDQLELQIADSYLQTFVPQLLAMPEFQPGGDGVLLVTFDESTPGVDNSCGGYPDPNNCGGHIWQVLIGPQVKRGYISTTHYMQGSQLRMFCDLLGLTSCPGDGAASPGMSEFFQ